MVLPHLASVAMLVGPDGEPVGFKHMDSPIHDPSHFEEVNDIVGRIGSECLYLADSNYAEYVDIAKLSLNGTRFIIPYHNVSERYASMFPEDCETSTETGYQLRSVRIGLDISRGPNGIIPPSDPHFENCNYTLNSFLYYDPRLGAKMVESMKQSLTEIKRSLNGQIASDPETMISTAAGTLEPFLRSTVDKDGKIRVSTRRNKLSEFSRNAGRYMIVTTEDDWADIVCSHEMKTNLLSAINQLYKGSNWFFKYFSKGTPITGQLFIEHIALVIYSEMQRVIRSNGKDMDIEEMLFIASSYKVILDNGMVVRSSRSRRIDGIFKMFSVEDDLDRREPPDGP